MIEFDMISYLSADATLDTLLGVTGSDTKIYPVQASAGATPPYILYSWTIGDWTDEILDEDRIQLRVISGTDFQKGADIRDRLKTLLDRQDLIQQTTFATGSNNYWIKWSKFSGGDVLIDTEKEYWNFILFFNVKYIKKT